MKQAKGGNWAERIRFGERRFAAFRYKHLVIFLLSFLVIAAAIDDLPDDTQGDEIGFGTIGMKLGKVYLADFLLHQNVANPAWQELFGRYGRSNPRVGLYVTGFVYFLSKALHVNFRYLAAILAGVCVLLFFQLGYLLGGLRCGLLAAFFLLLNPIFRSMQVRLMLEIPVLLFALASLYFLARWEKDLRNGDFSWVRLAWFSLFAGFSISSKLYGFSLYLAFLLVFMLNVKKLSSRAWGSLGLVVGVGLFIFIFSNPLLLHDPLFALKSMTVAHVAGEDGGSITRWSLSSLKYMLTYPFLFARAGTFDLDTVFRPPVYGQDVIFLFFGYLLAVLGVIGAFKRGLVVPFAFLFGAVLMQGYVVSTHGEGWMMPRVLFFPAVAVAWFYCFIDWSSIIGFFRRGPKSQDEPVSKERILSDE